MTQSDLTGLKPTLLSLALLTACTAWSQSAETEYLPGTAPPRLLLRPQRLRLLQRERQRQSMRWEQLDALVRGGAFLPEPGFALALYYRVSADEDAGRRAVQWALAGATDLRQIALVMDWCAPVMDASQIASLARRLEEALRRPAGDSVPEARSRVFAALALADQQPRMAAAELRRVVESWWRGRVAPGLGRGKPIPRTEHYALLELLHVLRDNLDLDLREDARAWFIQLPLFRLMTYYPAPYPGGENDYRIPVSAPAEPDLMAAMVSRAADMAMVAYEPNAQETQFLQGWVMQDRYLMRHPFGVPYEFLWANPYHPGLTYHSLPLLFHDPKSGYLFLRSSWEDDAMWLGHFDGSLQVFADGRPRRLVPGKATDTIAIGDARVVCAGARERFRVPEGNGPLFILGLKAHHAYDVEVDDEEMREERTDAGGILALPANTAGGLRLRSRGPAPER